MALSTSSSGSMATGATTKLCSTSAGASGCCSVSSRFLRRTSGVNSGNGSNRAVSCLNTVAYTLVQKALARLGLHPFYSRGQPQAMSKFLIALTINACVVAAHSATIARPIRAPVSRQSPRTIRGQMQHVCGASEEPSDGRHIDYRSPLKILTYQNNGESASGAVDKFFDERNVAWGDRTGRRREFPNVRRSCPADYISEKSRRT